MSLEEAVARYERYECATSPDSQICKGQLSLIAVMAKQKFMREYGLRGVSVDDVERALARGDATIGGQPAAVARAALGQGDAYALSVTGRATVPPPPARPTPAETDALERRIEAVLEEKCLERGGEWIGGECALGPRPLPPVTYVPPAAIPSGLSSGQKLAAGAAVALVAVLAWTFR